MTVVRAAVLGILVLLVALELFPGGPLVPPAGPPWLRTAWVLLFGDEAGGLFGEAEIRYGKGDFEKALVLCETLLSRFPGHSAAKALQFELLFLLGRAKVAPPTGEFDYSWVRPAQIPRETVLGEVDAALERVDGLIAEADGEEAERTCRRILEYAKWSPAGAELDRRVERANARFDYVRGWAIAR